MRLSVLFLPLALAACNSAAVTEVTRAAAKSVVNAELRTQLPAGVNVTPVTDCVIDNASAGEILSLAGAAATGPTSRTADTVSAILRRDGTITCIGTEALPTLLTAL